MLVKVHYVMSLGIMHVMSLEHLSNLRVENCNDL